MRCYYIYTWDPEISAFTPQDGVVCAPWSKWGLRLAFLALRAMGYMVTRGDPSVYVEAREEAEE